MSHLVWNETVHNTARSTDNSGDLYPKKKSFHESGSLIAYKSNISEYAGIYILQGHQAESRLPRANETSVGKVLENRHHVMIAWLHVRRQGPFKLRKSTEK